MKFITFLEFFSNFEYKVPKDKEHLLYDFFMMSMLSGYFKHEPSKNGDREDELNTTFKETENILLPYLKKEMLDITYFAMCSEARHGIKQSRAIKNSIMNTDKGGIFQSSYWGSNSKQENRKYAFDAMNKAFNNNKLEAVEFMNKLFNEDFWEEQYGGKPWVEISDCWLKLYRAKSKNDLYVYINLCYNLEHNTGSVFNKSEDYNINKFKQGLKEEIQPYLWIKKASDHKHIIDEPIELINHISPSLRTLALRILKNKENQTLKSTEVDYSKYENLMNKLGGVRVAAYKLYYNYSDEKKEITKYLINQKNFDVLSVKQFQTLAEKIQESLDLIKNFKADNWDWFSFENKTKLTIVFGSYDSFRRFREEIADNELRRAFDWLYNLGIKKEDIQMLITKIQELHKEFKANWAKANNL